MLRFLSAGLVLPPKVTSGVHLERVAGMKGLTSLSLYGCSAVSDDHLATLARSPSLAASLRLLLLCGTNITDAGLKAPTTQLLPLSRHTRLT